jgi:hypothetical protein
VFFILAGIASAAVLRGVYEAAFGIKPREIKDTPRRLVWLRVLVDGSLLAGRVGPDLRSSAGPVALGVGGLIALTLFWWLTMFVLIRAGSRGKSCSRAHWRSACSGWGWGSCSPSPSLGW